MQPQQIEQVPSLRRSGTASIAGQKKGKPFDSIRFALEKVSFRWMCVYYALRSVGEENSFRISRASSFEMETRID